MSWTYGTDESLCRSLNVWNLTGGFIFVCLDLESKLLSRLHLKKWNAVHFYAPFLNGHIKIKICVKISQICVWFIYRVRFAVLHICSNAITDILYTYILANECWVLGNAKVSEIGFSRSQRLPINDPQTQSHMCKLMRIHSICAYLIHVFSQLRASTHFPFIALCIRKYVFMSSSIYRSGDFYTILIISILTH